MHLLALEQLKQLMAINSHTGNKDGVDENGEMFCKWMQTLGFQVERFKRDTIGDHWWYQSSHHPNKPRLLLLGHLDTVFPPNTFETVTEDEHWLYGPGGCDMKGGNMVALQALRNCHASKGSIHNVDMLLVSDEESGSDDSKHLTTDLAKHYDYCLVFEAAGTDHHVVVARKGVGTFTLQFTGKAAHAGNHFTDGADANLAAAKALIALSELTDLSKNTTLNVGKVKGGRSANTISPYCTLVVEARFTQASERDRIVSGLENICQTEWQAGVSCELGGGLQRDVMQANDKQQHFLTQINELLGYELPIESRGGVSDANVVANAGLPVLDGFGPYGDGDHTEKERMLKSSFERRIQEVSQIVAHFSA